MPCGRGNGCSCACLVRGAQAAAHRATSDPSPHTEEFRRTYDVECAEANVYFRNGPTVCDKAHRLELAVTQRLTTRWFAFLSIALLSTVQFALQNLYWHLSAPFYYVDGSRAPRSIYRNTRTQDEYDLESITPFTYLLTGLWMASGVAWDVVQQLTTK